MEHPYLVNRVNFESSLRICFKNSFSDLSNVEAAMERPSLIERILQIPVTLLSPESSQLSAGKLFNVAASPKPVKLES